MRNSRMTTTIQIKTDLWEQLTALAQQQQKHPDQLLEKLVAEYLVIQTDLQLDDAIRLQVQNSGFKESDTIALVNQYRNKKSS